MTPNPAPEPPSFAQTVSAFLRTASAFTFSAELPSPACALYSLPTPIAGGYMRIRDFVETHHQRLCEHLAALDTTGEEYACAALQLGAMMLYSNWEGGTRYLQAAKSYFGDRRFTGPHEAFLADLMETYSRFYDQHWKFPMAEVDEIVDKAEALPAGDLATIARVHAHLFRMKVASEFDNHRPGVAADTTARRDSMRAAAALLEGARHLWDHPITVDVALAIGTFDRLISPQDRVGWLTRAANILEAMRPTDPALVSLYEELAQLHGDRSSGDVRDPAKALTYHHKVLGILSGQQEQDLDYMLLTRVEIVKLLTELQDSRRGIREAVQLVRQVRTMLLASNPEAILNDTHGQDALEVAATFAEQVMNDRETANVALRLFVDMVITVVQRERDGSYDDIPAEQRQRFAKLMDRIAANYDRLEQADLAEPYREQADSCRPNLP